MVGRNGKCLVTTGFHVYVMYDDRTGECIYVGLSGRFKARMSMHRRTSPWWDDVTRIETEACDTKEQAIWLERILIRTLDPRENLEGKIPELIEWRQQCRERVAS